jgi:hypothetical protein
MEPYNSIPLQGWISDESKCSSRLCKGRFAASFRENISLVRVGSPEKMLVRRVYHFRLGETRRIFSVCKNSLKGTRMCVTSAGITLRVSL